MICLCTTHHGLCSTTMFSWQISGPKKIALEMEMHHFSWMLSSNASSYLFYALFLDFCYFNCHMACVLSFMSTTEVHQYNIFRKILRTTNFKFNCLIGKLSVYIYIFSFSNSHEDIWEHGNMLQYVRWCGTPNTIQLRCLKQQSLEW